MDLEPELPLPPPLLRGEEPYVPARMGRGGVGRIGRYRWGRGVHRRVDRGSGAASRRPIPG
jgi:hypothetical protein